MPRRALISFLAVLLVVSWTGEFSGYFPAASEAQAKPGGSGKGAGRGGGGKSAGNNGSRSGKGSKSQNNSASSQRGKNAAHAPNKGKGPQAAAKTPARQAKAAPAAIGAGPAPKTAPPRTERSSPAQSWTAQIQGLQPRDQMPKRNVMREIVVSTTNPGAMEALAAAGIKPVALKETYGTTLLKLEVPRTLATAAALRLVEEKEPRAIASGNDLYFPAEHSDCPGCEPASSPALSTHCTTKVTLGLIDTKVDLSHPALRDQDVRVLKSREGPSSSAAHGTSVAALLVGKASNGTAGVVPGATLLATDAFASDANGDFTDAFALSAALDTLVEAGAQVINLSLAGPSNEVLRDAVERAVAKGVIVVASVGNTSGADRAYPAAYPNVISVTAVDTHNDVYRYANRGPFVDFAAPGVALSIPGGDLVPVSGTSFATPFVTAAAAVLRSTNRYEDTSLDELLKEAAIDLGEPGRDEVFGWGMIDLASVCAAEMPLAKTSPKNLAAPE